MRGTVRLSGAKPMAQCATCRCKDDVVASRVFFQEIRDVIDLPVQNEPAGLIRGVLLNLVQADDAVAGRHGVQHYAASTILVYAALRY